jgi:hypothetical protein
MKLNVSLRGLFAASLAMAGIGGLAPISRASDSAVDMGVLYEKLLSASSYLIYGTGRPLTASAPSTRDAAGVAIPYRTAEQPAGAQVLLAGGLRAEYVTRGLADAGDMIALWPSDEAATHLVVCIEGGREEIGTFPDGRVKYNPSVQRVKLAGGQVETLLRGMSGCDGIRRTAHGTILATEEETDGGAYEIYEPLATSEETVVDRATGEVVDSANATSAHIVRRLALPTIAWEGIAALPSGVLIAGDELRPGTNGADSDGGALFKFIPSTAWTGGAPAAFPDSPYASGRVYALQISCRNDRQQYGQGCEIGNGGWLEVGAVTATADAFRLGATGYYRPEDLHEDPAFVDPADADAVRFCWTNTGNEAGKNYAELVCGVDSAPLEAPRDASNRVLRSVVVNRFVEGDLDFNSMDNFAFQPRTGNHYVIEDHDNGDVFACLPDGADRDIKTDGCVKLVSVRDSSAEPTGFVFSGDGRTAYVVIQHSDDSLMPSADDYPTDDLLKITGFRVPGR